MRRTVMSVQKEMMVEIEVMQRGIEGIDRAMVTADREQHIREGEGQRECRRREGFIEGELKSCGRI